MGAIYRALLERIERRDYDVFSARGPDSAAAARAHRRGHLGPDRARSRDLDGPTSSSIGAGFAGLSAAAALADAGARVLVLDARPQLGGRATAFRRSRDRRAGRQRPARAVRLLSRDVGVPGVGSAPTSNVRRAAGAGACRVLRPGAAAARCCDVRRCRRRCTCWPACSRGRRFRGASGCRCCGWRCRCSRARRQLRAARHDRGRSPGTSPCRSGSIITDRARTLQEWLWDPLAVAALNQSARRCRGGRRSSGSWRRCSGPIRRRRRWCCRSGRCTRCTPSRRARYHGARRRGPDLARWRGVRVRDGRVDAVEVRGELMSSRSGDRRRALVRPARRCSAAIRRRRSTASSPCGRAMAPMPIVTVNLWYDRTVMDEAVRRAARPRRCSGCSTSGIAFGGAASHLSLVSSGADRDRRLHQRGAGRAARQERSRPRCRRARGAGRPRRRWSARSRRRSRSRPGSRRGRARARRSRACFSPATGSTPGSRRRSRARW